MDDQADPPVPDEIREEIAHAVRKALSRHGYAGLTTKQVAAECSMSEAGLYYYYGSKDELVAAFLESTTGWLSDRLEGLDAETPRGRLLALCDQLLVWDGDRSLRGLNVAVMELLGHAPHNETLREPLESYQRYVYETLVAVIEAGNETGDFQVREPEAAAAFLHAMADGTTGFGLALENDQLLAVARSELHRYVEECIVAPSSAD